MQPIKVTECVPNQINKCYLVFCTNKCWYTAYFQAHKDDWYCFYSGRPIDHEVTHWMPTPGSGWVDEEY